MSSSDWQDKLRTGMDSYSEPVPDSVWKAVESGVGAARERQRRLRRRRRMFAGAVSAFAAAALAAVAIFPANDGPVAAAPSSRILALAGDPVLQPALFRVGEAPALDAAVRRTPADAFVPADAPAWDVPDPGRSGAPAEEIPAPAPGPAESVPAETMAVPEDVTAESFWNDDVFFLPADDDAGGKMRVTLGFRASNVAPGHSEASGYGGLYGASVVPSPTSAREQLQGYSSVLLSNNSQPVSTSTEHYQPVSFGLALSVGLGDRFSLETGADYSCLVSDMSSGTEENRYDIRQTLHYVGVPLRARYSFWKPGGFDLYMTAGGKVEKCVGGTTSTSYVVKSSVSSSTKDRITVDPLQWSVGASLGIGYRFNDLVGIYLEPGVSYYFDNGSFVETVYRERPLNFSLGIGLRFNLN